MNTDWMKRAACEDMNTNMFFPDKAEDEGPARAVCSQCTVAQQCLQYALAQNTSLAGIWGNTNKRQRKRIREGGTAARPLEQSGMAAVNAAKTHCKRNHEFTPENTRWSNGHRSCRTCYNVWLRKRRQATREAVAA
ncbi:MULTISPECIES: WhiB family transcriptional regulator [Glycomyces]|uniref:4Fe-4S Wbl-type domain-containing protein n=2 Tax=Glycomyces TaxID=58113 RepID=A0ABU2AHU6_9ACTN|nr:WhiB family transcriptional regulator [Glycomyces lechevalierae]MDR7336786.1 hypothetical protein [Glycomyces lechevalierae]